MSADRAGKVSSHLKSKVKHSILYSILLCLHGVSLPGTMNTSCHCTSELGYLAGFTSIDTLSTAEILDFAGRAIAIAKAANRCSNGCTTTRRSGQAFLETLGRVIEYLGALWQTTSSQDACEAAFTPSTQSAPSSWSYGHQNNRSRVTAIKSDRATLGRLTLDATEARLLVRETIRTLTSSINDIAFEASSQAERTGLPTDSGDSCKDAWLRLVDRTYSDLASYRSSTAY